MKVCFILLHFYKRPTLIPVFANWKKSEEDFHFYEKSQKVKIVFSICLAAISYRSSTHPKQWEWYCQASSPGMTLSISASSCHSFELYLWASVIYFSLFCASVSKMCPKVITSSLYAISAYEWFHRISLLLESVGNLYLTKVLGITPTWILHKIKPIFFILFTSKLTSVSLTCLKSKLYPCLSLIKSSFPLLISYIPD